MSEMGQLTSFERRPATRCVVAAWISALLLAGCSDDPPSNVFQGYVEAEFIDVAAGVAGTLDELKVERGDRVAVGDLLFALDDTPHAAAVREATAQLAHARSTLEDLKKGRRPSEIRSIEAQLEQAQVALNLSERELGRVTQLHKKGAATPDQVDAARTAYELDRQRVSQQNAELETARLGARADQIEAAEAEVKAREAMLAHAQWELAQTHQMTTHDAQVFDVLFREGEWVATGQPAVVLLPPQLVKVRVFVPQSRVATIHAGDKARIDIDGRPKPITGTVSFVSPKAEYTPPVIYSRESRAKLVFMIEIIFDPEIAATLHPGQPVDVVFIEKTGSVKKSGSVKEVAGEGEGTT